MAKTQKTIFKIGSIASIINDNNEDIKPIKKIKNKTKLMKKFNEIIEQNYNKEIEIENIEEMDKNEDMNASDNGSDDESDERQLIKSKNKKLKKQTKKDPKEKTERTVFVGNLPKSITIKNIKKMFGKFGRIQSVRLRGAVPQKEKMTKKLAVITKSLHSRKDNINAYIVYKSRDDVFKALEMNGNIIDGHHIRVDSAGNDSPLDHLRSIFVGNLPFVIKEDDLFDFFKDCGDIEAVRVVRDPKTGVGKGFALISFKSKDSVILALELNEQKLKGRQIRVMRAKSEKNAIKQKPNKKKLISKKSKSETKIKKELDSSEPNSETKPKKELIEENESNSETKPKKRLVSDESTSKNKKKLKKSDSKPKFEGILAKKTKRKLKKKKEMNSIKLKLKQKKLANIFSH